MKKIIYFFGITFLIIITILNIIFTAYLDSKEHITINFNTFIYVICLIILGVFLYFVTKLINNYLYKDENSKLIQNNRKFFFSFSIVLYVIFNIVWIIFVRPPIVGDQIHVRNLAQTFYRGNLTEFLLDMTYANIPLSEYMQAYHQQISLSFAFSILFRIIHFDSYGILRVLNIISNLFIVIGLYKISNHLSKKYTSNKVLLLTLILTFITIPMLANFIYGDFPSLSLCLFSVYFMMRYVESKKIAYPIMASIFTSIAYMMRMNSLIFIIATVIYLLLNLFNKGFFKKTCKENLFKTFIIVIYICISIFPASLVKNYYLNKYNLDSSKEYPNISYFLMAMEEGPRGNGWYNETRGEYALKNPENAKKEYLELIKERISYFSKNLGYTFDFYTKKIASMWTENTYSAIRNNTTMENSLIIENMIEPLTFYQKALLILICICSLIALFQNRKSLSLDILFLITIFIGGFSFHILWEAKSRYIIPYIVVLIPIASIKLNSFGIIDKIKQKLYKK